MNKTTKIILGASVAAGIVAATIYYIIRSRMLKECSKNMREELHIIKPKQRFRLIAKALDRDIKNIERRTSKHYHNQNQKKYNEINWDTEITCRENIFNN